VKSLSTISIEPPRLKLRNLTPRDITRDYVNWLNDPAVNTYLSCAGKTQTRESCLAYVQSYEGRTDTALIGIFLKQPEEHIGNITLSSVDWKNRVATVGISVGRSDCMGKGYGREALSAVLDYCFSDLALHRVQAGVSEKNLPSLKLFIACGLKIEGLLRENNSIGGKMQSSYILGKLQTDRE